MADEPDLRRGDNDEAWVQYLQGLLEAAGHSPGPIDGIFGPRTEAAVESFQGANNCTVDGWVGPQTWGALNALGLTPVQPADGGGGDQSGEKTIDLDPSDFPALSYMLQFGDSESGTDQYLAALGVDVDGLSDDDTAIA